MEAGNVTKNSQVDNTGKVYIFYKIEELAKELGRGLSAIKININELVTAGLIQKRRADKGRANIIYVKVPDSSVIANALLDKSYTVKMTNFPTIINDLLSKYGYDHQRIGGTLSDA